MWHVGDWGDFGSAVAGGSAALALIFGFFQILEAKRVARETNALQSHREYLSMCLQHPELSSSLMFAMPRAITDFSEIKKMMTEESETYLWLLSILLNNCEQVLESVKDDEAWRKVLRDQLRIHYPALKALWDDWGEGYGEKLKLLWSEVDALGPEDDWKHHVERPNSSRRRLCRRAPAHYALCRKIDSTIPQRPMPRRTEKRRSEIG